MSYVSTYSPSPWLVKKKDGDLFIPPPLGLIQRWLKLWSLVENIAAMELIENIAASDHVILCDRAYTPTKKSLLELTSQDALLAQNNLLAKQLETLTETVSKLPQ